MKTKLNKLRELIRYWDETSIDPTDKIGDGSTEIVSDANDESKKTNIRLIDRVLTFIGDAIIVIPSLPILILISSMMSGRTSIMTIAAVLTVFNWPWPARQARAMALTIREREFINTAHFSGANRLKIIVCEILPYVASWAMSNFINTIMVAIGTESSLAILGLSSTTTATLGNMIYWARQYQAILQERWIWIGIPVGLTMLLFIGLFMTFTGYSDYTSRKRGR